MSYRKYHGKNLRKGRVSIPGQIYSITTVTRHRQPVFADFAAARTLIGVLREQKEYGHAKTLCFVVMPDHLHWLMQVTGNKDLGRVMQGVKSLTSRRATKRIWQKGFYDHALRREEDVKALARYIVANPLRSGLVSHVNDYPHWDAVWL